MRQLLHSATCGLHRSLRKFLCHANTSLHQLESLWHFVLLQQRFANQELQANALSMNVASEQLHLCLRWEKQTIHRPAPVQNLNFSLQNGVHRGKISVVDMVSLVFVGFASTTGLESFSLRPEKFS